MRNIARMRAHLGAAISLPDVLTVSQDGFRLVRTICGTCEDRGDEMFATFALAAASALQGRNIVVAAPSMPPDRPADAAPALAETASVEHSLEEIADALADLASALASRLRQAAAQATGAGDRAACQEAAAEADSIHGLLAPGG